MSDIPGRLAGHSHDDETALRELVQRLEREREAQKPPMLEYATPSGMRLREPGDCPFPHTLLMRTVGFEGLPLSPDDIARCLRVRRRFPVFVLDRVTVTCVPVSVTLPEGMQPAYPDCSLGHVELLADERRVHIEAIAQTLRSPGGSHRELRVYVDGVLEGRSINIGRLGATANSFPVVAGVGPDHVMTVEPVHWTRFDEFILELRQRWAAAIEQIVKS